MAEVLRFDTLDYAVFATMIAISVAIGIYTARTEGRQRTAEEILLGNRNLNPIAVGLSICASLVSATSMIGTPGEIYRYDTMYAWSVVAYILSSILVCLLLFPVYFRIRITSVNEYLELRFNKALRVLATISLLLSTGLANGIGLYAPALALNAVTGMSIWACILTTGVACTFYTTLGGIKAVVLTDSIQSIIIIAGIVAVVVKGTIEVGGVDEVFRRGVEGKRIRFLETSPDPTIIYSVWSVMLGIGTANMRLGISQAMAQRVIACGTRIRATQALIVSVVGDVFIESLIIICGVVMYAYYFGCDPLTSGVVRSQDQLMPLLVMELFASVPGIPGLFLSAVAAGSVSSLSTGISALVSVTGEDLLKPVFRKMKPNTYAWILKGLTLFFGGVAIMFAYLVGLLGQGVFQISFSLAGIPAGPLLGVFLLGMYCHRCNGKGALAGFLSSILFLCWIRVGSFLYPSYRGQNPLSIDDCPALNSSTAAMYSTFETEFKSSTSDYQREATTSAPDMPDVSGLINLYHISFLYYYPIGAGFTMVVGMAVSALTGFQNPATIDPRLIQNLTDALFWYLPESVKYKMRCGEEDIRRGTTDREFPEEEMKEIENGQVNQGFTKDGDDDEDDDKKKNAI